MTSALVSENIIYEQPLNERIRTFLRLEFLFQQIDNNLQGCSPWDSRAALMTLIEIQQITSRTDLKKEFLKELERLSTKLASLGNSPDVDKSKLHTLLDRLTDSEARFHRLQGQIGQALRDYELINCIRQRSAVPGGTSGFDLPVFHCWLNLPAEQRRADLLQWLTELELARSAVTLILQLIRDSAAPVEITAAAGFYQQTLDTSAPFQLVRVLLPADSRCFAEISGGKHRFTIRFMELNTRDRPCQTQEDVDFKLTNCVI